MNIFLDIETTPSVDPSVHNDISLGVAPPGNIKKKETIEAWTRDEKPNAVHEAIAKTSFSGMYGNICVIGVAIDDQDPVAFFVDSTEPHKHEAKILTDFYAYISAAYNPSSQTRPVFVGHNLLDFDLRFMFQRSVVLGIRPPAFIPFQAKPWDATVCDTMTAWAGVRERVKLDKLAKALGLEGKQGMDGSMVWPEVAGGRIKEVADYCANIDVRQTREVFKRLTFQTTA